MKKLSGSEHTKFNLLVASRQEEEIKSELKCWLHQDNFISIQQERVNSDIHAYIRKRLQADREFERWHSMTFVQEEIETELMKKADGMYALPFVVFEVFSDWRLLCQQVQMGRLPT